MGASDGRVPGATHSTNRAAILDPLCAVRGLGAQEKQQQGPGSLGGHRAEGRGAAAVAQMRGEGRRACCAWTVEVLHVLSAGV